MHKPSFKDAWKDMKILSALMHSYYICFIWLKGLPIVLILHPLGHLMNFQTNTWKSLWFKPISNLTMICYHQNAIRRTLRITISIMKPPTFDSRHVISPRESWLIWPIKIWFGKPIKEEKEQQMGNTLFSRGTHQLKSWHLEKLASGLDN